MTTHTQTILNDQYDRGIKDVRDVTLRQLDCINKNAEGINKLAKFLNTTQDHLNLMATKVLELEKKLEKYEKIMAKYQMTADVPFPEVEVDEDGIPL